MMRLLLNICWVDKQCLNFINSIHKKEYNILNIQKCRFICFAVYLPFKKNIIMDKKVTTLLEDFSSS